MGIQSESKPSSPKPPTQTISWFKKKKQKPPETSHGAWYNPLAPVPTSPIGMEWTHPTPNRWGAVVCKNSTGVSCNSVLPCCKPEAGEKARRKTTFNWLVVSTNPFEQYARQIGFIFLQFPGWTLKHIWVATTQSPTIHGIIFGKIGPSKLPLV